MIGFMCGPKIYEYDGWTFEFGYCGPWPVRKNGELYKRAGAKFWDMFDRFMRLSESEREAYRVGGGCQRFEA